MKTIFSLKIVASVALLLLFVACSSAEPQLIETPNVEATVQFRLTEERSKSDPTSLPSNLATSIKPSPTITAKQTKDINPRKIPALPVSKSSTPVVLPTPIVPLVTIQIPSPSPSYDQTATSSPTETPQKRHALYVNNVQVQSGQTEISIQYGTVRISPSPDYDSLYQEGETVDWEIRPTTPNSEIDYLWGLEPTENASGTISLSGEYRILVKISPPPLPTPTPTPPSIRRSGTPTPTPVYKVLTVSPDCSERGSELEIDGSGFEANEEVHLTYLSGTTDTHLGSFALDARGSFSGTVTVPMHAQFNDQNSSNSITAANPRGGSHTASHRIPFASCSSSGLTPTSPTPTPLEPVDEDRVRELLNEGGYPSGWGECSNGFGDAKIIEALELLGYAGMWVVMGETDPAFVVTIC